LQVADLLALGSSFQSSAVFRESSESTRSQDFALGAI
jgi:hypothetical protein